MKQLCALDIFGKEVLVKFFKELREKFANILSGTSL